MAQRVFIVTGANKGIGFEVVRKLCKELKNENAVVVLTSRDPENGAQAVAKLEKEDGLKPEMEQLDITNEESRKRFVENIKNKYGKVECLVNNAGFAFKQSATEPMGVQAKVTCGINYYGTRDMMKAMTTLFKPGCRIVNVASGSGKTAFANMSAENKHRLMSKSATVEDIDKVVEDFIAACEKNQMDGWPNTCYGFSKAAEIALTAVWARMCDRCPGLSEGGGAVVTCCCPGWCKTDMAGWEDPPRTAAQGADDIVSLALGATKEHHGKFVKEGHIYDFSED